MAKITLEDFQALLNMLEKGEGRDWQPLFHIFEKHEKPIIRNKYIALRNNPETNDNSVEFEDHCQEILYKICRSADKAVAKTQEYELETRIMMYAGWTKEVIENYFLTYINKVKKQIKADSISYDDMEIDIPAPEGNEIGSAQLQNLINSFRFVMNSRRKIYIKLTWVGCGIIMIALGDARKNVTQYMEVVFSRLTLGEMYSIITNASRKIIWLSMDPQDWCKLELELLEIHDNGMPYAQCIYSDFYMDKGARASISNWITNINSELKKEGLLWNI